MVSAASLLLFLVVPALSLRKCCPQGSSLQLSDNIDPICSESTHAWHYINFTTGIPECNFTQDIASRGSLVSCIDNREGSDSVIALNCTENDDKFQVPNVNYLRKCCPFQRVYDSHMQTCWGEQKDSWPTSFLNVLMYNADGVLDLDIGVPNCSWNQVVVDHAVISENVYRDQSGSISFTSRGKKYLMNPDDVCLDQTERRGVIVVRVCEDETIACSTHTCLRKCCPEGTSYDEGFSKLCIPSSRSIRPMKVFYKSGDKFEPVMAKNPAYWYGLSCPHRKYLEDKADTYYLDLEGSITNIDGITTDVGLFCIENVYFGGNDSNDGDYLFLCFLEEEYYPSVHMWTTFGMMVSCFFLFLTLVVYLCLPSLQNLHGKTLMCHVTCLLAAYTGLVTVHLVTDQLLQQICVIMGFFVQFTFLAAFFWLNVLSFDIWWTFGSMRPIQNRRRRDLRRFVMYCVYAWTVPCVITAGSIVVDNSNIIPKHLRPGIGSESCWFAREFYGHLLFFSGPEGVLVACNVLFFALTARHCSQVKNELDKVGHTAIADKKFQSDKKKLIMNCKLFIVMGISWAMEVVSEMVREPPEVWYLADMANAIQGLLIFSIFVCKKRVWDNLKERFYGCFRKTPARRSSISTICTLSNVSTNNLKKSVSETRLSPLPMCKNPNLRTRSSNRLLV